MTQAFLRLAPLDLPPARIRGRGRAEEFSTPAASSSNNVLLLVVALGILMAVLIVSRPKRKRP